MFEAIAHILPPYQQIFETIQHVGVDAQLPSEDARLAALLSHVYADLVQLFLDLYRTFCRGAQGTFSNSSCVSEYYRWNGTFVISSHKAPAGVPKGSKPEGILLHVIRSVSNCLILLADAIISLHHERNTSNDCG
jgi:hypothetical protein